MNNLAAACEGSMSADQGTGDVVSVAVNSLSTGDSPRLAGVDERHVNVLAQLDRLPPLLVHRGSMRVIDGMHRLAAAKSRGVTAIDVRFFDGDPDSAFVEAVRVNGAHGLPLTLADRRAAATRIVRGHPEWSDRRIAEVVGLSPKTVGVVRRRTTEEFPQSPARIGRDGKVRRLPVRPMAREAVETVPREPAADGEGVGPRRSALAVPGGAESAPSRNAAPPPRPDFDAERCQRTLSALAQDPSLRMSETGRFLLRLLKLHIARGRDWEQLLSNVPAHRADAVANLARECAKTWLDFAEKVVVDDV